MKRRERLTPCGCNENNDVGGDWVAKRYRTPAQHMLVAPLDDEITPPRSCVSELGQQLTGTPSPALL